MALVQFTGVSKTFNGVHALRNIDVAFGEKGVVAIIGPNGAGKTTLLNVLSGFLRPDTGRVAFNSHDITYMSPDRIARLGLIRTFQDLRLIPSMTVLDNVLLARPRQGGERITRALFGLRGQREESANRAAAIAVLERFGLSDERLLIELAGDLSYGQQKLLSLACCLAAEPRALFLDEPVACIAPQFRDRILNLIREIGGEGRLVVFVEHDMDAVRLAADRVIVMDDGRIIVDGKPADILGKAAIMEAYLD